MSILQHLRFYWPSAALASLVILHESYSDVAKQELQNAGDAVAQCAQTLVVSCRLTAGRAVVFHQVNLTAAFSGANGSEAEMSSFGLGYRGMCRLVSFLRLQYAYICKIFELL